MVSVCGHAIGPTASGKAVAHVLGGVPGPLEGRALQCEWSNTLKNKVGSRRTRLGAVSKTIAAVAALKQ